MVEKKNKRCDTCIENEEYICIYKCNNHSRWKGCPNGYNCCPTGCELYRDDCKFGLSKNIDCQG